MFVSKEWTVKIGRMNKYLFNFDFCINNFHIEIFKTMARIIPLLVSFLLTLGWHEEIIQWHQMKGCWCHSLMLSFAYSNIFCSTALRHRLWTGVKLWSKLQIQMTMRPQKLRVSPARQWPGHFVLFGSKKGCWDFSRDFMLRSWRLY